MNALAIIRLACCSDPVVYPRTDCPCSNTPNGQCANTPKKV